MFSGTTRHTARGIRMKRLLLLAALFMAAIVPATAQQPQLPPQPKVHPAGIPKDALLVSPCIVDMGEHWANPRNLPVGPIYGVYNGKPVFSEIMIDQKAF